MVYPLQKVIYQDLQLLTLTDLENQLNQKEKNNVKLKITNNNFSKFTEK